MFFDGGVNAGWTFYVPLSIMNSSCMDLMLFSLHLAGLSSLLGSLNFIVSLLKACNLSILYSSLFLPLFPWSILFTSLLLIISLPVLAGCITMIIFYSIFSLYLCCISYWSSFWRSSCCWCGCVFSISCLLLAQHFNSIKIGICSFDHYIISSFFLSLQWISNCSSYFHYLTMLLSIPFSEFILASEKQVY